MGSLHQVQEPGLPIEADPANRHLPWHPLGGGHDAGPSFASSVNEGASSEAVLRHGIWILQPDVDPDVFMGLFGISTPAFLHDGESWIAFVALVVKRLCRAYLW